MKQIKLTRGLFTLVDDEDYPTLVGYKWHAHWFAKGQTFYAMRGEWNHGRQKMILMHRQIMGLIPGDGRQVDHKNRDGLDNRRKSNLRIATRSQNLANSKVPITNRSGHKGVSWDRRKRAWRATIRDNGKQYFLGYFDSVSEAHEAYCDAAVRIHGEFARTS